ncbi:MAG: orotate phosphoribosyltransferase [Acidimicrobiia bacterium]|nr:orotate phosphoribosyltransferase [Acidimicrobiia bacterium]
MARITGQFTLRSGQQATEYFDKYRFEADPALLVDVGAALAALVPEGTEVLAGLELGGVPLATALSLHSGLPAAFVRKEAKTYGTCRLAEGAEVDGRRVLVVEDVVTTGGQVVTSIGQLRDAGAVITHAVCVIDRSTGGEGAAALAAVGVELRPLLVRADLDAARAQAESV